MDNEESKLRVFISYSHNDRSVVNAIAEVLRENGLEPMYDKDFVEGRGFHEQIKSYIAHAHVFLPVITESSSGWVHQEIGYATALHIPVLPVVIVADRLPREMIEKLLPKGMIEQLLAVRVDRKLTGLARKLPRKKFRDMVDASRNTASALFECAHHTEDRAELLEAYSDSVRYMGMTGQVRQRGALSSFHIPWQDLGHRYWVERYGPGFPLNKPRCEKLRKERAALEQHAQAAGCRIIIDPTLDYGGYGPKARKVRLQSLLEFLAPDKTAGAARAKVADVQVALNPKLVNEENVIIVGDFFCAQAISGEIGQGYRQTVFTRHAPTIAAEIQAFDVMFERLIYEAGWTKKTSRKCAADYLRRIIATL